MASCTAYARFICCPIPFDNPSAVRHDDPGYASSTQEYPPSDWDARIQFLPSDFSSIPFGSTINSITVSVTRKASQSSDTVYIMDNDNSGGFVSILVRNRNILIGNTSPYYEPRKWGTEFETVSFNMTPSVSDHDYIRLLGPVSIQYLFSGVCTASTPITAYIKEASIVVTYTPPDKIDSVLGGLLPSSVENHASGVGEWSYTSNAIYENGLYACTGSSSTVELQSLRAYYPASMFSSIPDDAEIVGFYLKMRRKGSIRQPYGARARDRNDYYDYVGKGVVVYRASDMYALAESNDTGTGQYYLGWSCPNDPFFADASDGSSENIIPVPCVYTPMSASVVKSSGVYAYLRRPIIESPYGIYVNAYVDNMDLFVRYRLPGWGGKRLSLGSSSVARISGVQRANILKVSGV